MMVVGYWFFIKIFFGCYMIVIGFNLEVVEMIGIVVDWYKIYVYVLMGVCVVLVGVMLMGKLNVIQVILVFYFNFYVIVVVVVGGILLFGGWVLMLGLFVGVLLLFMMINVLVMFWIEFFWQLVVFGVVIVLFVVFYIWLQKKDWDGVKGFLVGFMILESLKFICLFGGLIVLFVFLFFVGLLLMGNLIVSG